MAALVAEYLHHQIGSTIHHFRSIGEAGRRIDEAAEAHHADHLIEVTQRAFDLSEKIDGAGARSLLSILDRYATAELAFGDQLALGAKAELTGDHKQIAAAHERDIVGNRTGRAWQVDP